MLEKALFVTAIDEEGDVYWASSLEKELLFKVANDASGKAKVLGQKKIIGCVPCDRVHGKILIRHCKRSTCEIIDTSNAMRVQQ